MIDLNRLGAMRDRGHGITVHCTHCLHFAPADMDRLVARFGAEFHVVERRAELLAALRCGKCGGKVLEITLTTGGGFGGIGGHEGA